MPVVDIPLGNYAHHDYHIFLSFYCYLSIYPIITNSNSNHTYTDYSYLFEPIQTYTDTTNIFRHYYQHIRPILIRSTY